jgi:hypothetical protein
MAAVPDAMLRAQRQIRIGEEAHRRAGKGDVRDWIDEVYYVVNPDKPRHGEAHPDVDLDLIRQVASEEA